MEIDSEVTQMIELADKHIKIVIITQFHMLKKVGESMSMLKRGLVYEDFWKDPKYNLKEKFNDGDEKYLIGLTVD